MSLLRELQLAGVLRTLDDAFAQSLRRLDADTPDTVLAAAALASLAVAQGHAGFDPANPQLLADASLAWPPAQEWIPLLASSRWVATPADPHSESAPDAPLVLEQDPQGRSLLYLRRYREYERHLAAQLRRIADYPIAVTEAGLAALASLFADLFPGAGDGHDRQARAAAAALSHALLLITGGPGTGKTTTITRLLVLLIAQALQSGAAPPRIALAAPTGRAAERMAESLRASVLKLQADGIDPRLCEALPGSGTTLHRLLGTLADSPRFRHHAGHPLPFDVVVVDEASMIDLPLMAKLVDAVAHGARLVLLGDPDQLPSVEAGDVLGGILRAAGEGAGLSTANRHVLHALTGVANADGAIDHPRVFAGAHVHLQRGYRQDQALQLAPLATAIRQGNAASSLSLLRGDELAGVHFHENLADPLQAHRDHLLAHWQALAQASDPAQALSLAAKMRLLTVVREGPQGARSLNARIEELLMAAGSGPGGQAGRFGRGHPAASTSSRNFHGRLLLISENSYRHRLFNGDIGICLRDQDGSLVAWFPGEDAGQPRAFHPAALPAHESAFAMTVHKAQGSEFDEVWLLLPERYNRVLSRELVYTGITRARRELHVASSAQILGDALARHASRWSGLGWRLMV